MKSYQKLSKVIKKLSKLISMMQDILATTDTERFVVWKDSSWEGYSLKKQFLRRIYVDKMIIEVIYFFRERVDGQK